MRLPRGPLARPGGGVVSRRKGDWLTGSTRRAVRDYVGGRDGWHCHYCRKPFAEPSEATLDHYIPWCLWHMSKPRNLVLACWDCNQAKADALPLTLAWLLLSMAPRLTQTEMEAAA